MTIRAGQINAGGGAGFRVAALSILLLAVAGICNGDTLRISGLAENAGADAERMVLKNDDAEEVLFVKKEAVLGDADIEQAWPDPTHGNQIQVKLNEEGGRKLKEATAKMRHGQDRLAIIVDGRLVYAPVIQTTIGSSFVISGLKDLSPDELDGLARKMSRNSPDAGGKIPIPDAQVPKIESIPFTEQEYQRNKAMRERMGIFHIETVPSKKDLGKILRKGMSHAEVLELLGRPHLGPAKPEDGDFSLTYTIAPEKRPGNPERKMLPNGFKVDFHDRKVSWWSHTYSNAPREEKVVGREPPTLKAILPEVDLSADNVDFARYVERIVIPDPKQALNGRDLSDLLSIVTMLSGNTPDSDNDATLDSNCDFIRTLSHNFGEVAALRKKAEGGKMRISDLNDILSPYIHEGEVLPVESRQHAKPGPR